MNQLRNIRLQGIPGILGHVMSLVMSRGRRNRVLWRQRRADRRRLIQGLVDGRTVHVCR